MERGEKISISVPYVVGDYEGALTEALARAISRTANFEYSKDDGDWILNAKIIKTNNDRIGYRYDRDPKSGDLRKNIIGTENRKEISVEVSVLGPLEEIDPRDSEAITVGRHGLVAEHGLRRGLLLPQVASEWGWTLEQFLRQTCLKAGLPGDAWQHAARISRFDAEVFGE